MKYFIAMLVAVFSSQTFALGKTEEGVIIGLGGAYILHEIFGERSDRNYGGYGDYGYGNTSREFPPFRCRGDSVRCAYERGVWEREREIWQKEKDHAYRCGRYGECE